MKRPRFASCFAYKEVLDNSGGPSSGRFSSSRGRFEKDGTRMVKGEGWLVGLMVAEGVGGGATS